MLCLDMTLKNNILCTKLLIIKKYSIRQGFLITMTWGDFIYNTTPKLDKHFDR